MTQGARNRTLTKLRHGDVKVLVATDVAARGIDVHGITHVINYDLPKFAEDYVHRIGRTGRAGNTGIAISFASNMDRHILRKIEQFTGNTMSPAVIEGFEPKRAIKMDGPGGSRRDGHKPGGRGGFKPRDDRGGFGGRDGNRGDSRGPRADSRERPSFNRDAAPREANGNAGRPEFSRPDFNRTERPAGDRPRSFGDRPNAGGDRNRSERPANAGAPNRSFGDSVAFGKKPYARDGQASAGRGDSRGDNRGNRPDANRGNDNRVLSARYEGRTDAPRGDRSSAPTRRDGVKADAGRPQGRSEGRSAPRSNAGSNESRGFAGAGNSTPRRPRSFV